MRELEETIRVYANQIQVLALRNLLCNDRWEQEWPHIKARLVNQAQHRHFPRG